VILLKVIETGSLMLAIQLPPGMPHGSMFDGVQQLADLRNGFMPWWQRPCRLGANNPGQGPSNGARSSRPQGTTNPVLVLANVEPATSCHALRVI